MVEMKKKNK